MDQYKKSEASNAQRPDPPRLDSFTKGFVKKCARKLAGKFGFKRQDRDEIEQQLYLKLARHLHAADADDPRWKAFVAITVRRHVASIIRNSEAKKRDHRRVCSIHVQIEAGDDLVELADVISDGEVPSRRGLVRRSAQQLAELALDVRSCMAELPDDKERDVCERLMHDSISQVAQDIGIPRTTLNGRLGKVRRRFEERGLREYL
jgi:RNA polymerase sigma-70 factor (ECF subfamily)